jgi:ribosome-associated translation inhibitor RaiA
MTETRLTTELQQHVLPLRLLTVMAGMFLLAACASTPEPPTEQLRAAQQAITTAEQARVADYASPELNEARQKLAAANNAVAQEEMVLAQQLAEQSRVNAELASAKAEMLKAKAVNEDMQKSIDTLKQEMQRNTGVR